MAITGDLFNYLTFGNVNSKDYGIYISAEAVYDAPERAVEAVSVPGRNGDILIDQGKWNNINVEYKAGFVDNSADDFATNFAEFRNAIASQVGYQRLSDTYNADEYRLGTFADGLSMATVDINKAGEFSLIFNCKPQRFLTSGDTAISVASGDTLTNPTLYDASPLLEVEGYGNIQFNENDIYVVYGESAMGRVTLYEAQQVYSYADIKFDAWKLNTGDTFWFSRLMGAPMDFSLDIDLTPKEGITITGVNATNQSLNSTGMGNPVPWIEGDTVVYNAGVDNADSFTKGTSATLDLTFDLVLTGTNNNASFTETVPVEFHLRYDGAKSLILYGNFACDLLVTSIPKIYTGMLIGNSTRQLIENLIIDTETGDSYEMAEGQKVDRNEYVSMGSDLPKLATGDNTITYDNTITSLKFKPRWWQL